ncbi:MAG: 16S rRNA (guanine(527)-N(7))-methyltransferase RsmG [Geobacteraceae bacterium GWC2_48_7]|nr:MAG: 16S rRNA (guanine(527)-N(7))-methyltransferase RsmG [Geobacteraceae bacterium GWC2_48_7]
MPDYLEQALKLAGTNVTVEAKAQLEVFTAELLKWNKKLNLTAITDLKGISAKHIVDSLLISYLIDNKSLILDIGSGAGFPGIPLGITRADLEVISVDAVAKKIQFQKHIVRLLALLKFNPIHSRIEDLDKIYTGKFDVIVSRAFTSLGHFAEISKPFMKPNGKIIAMKGPGAFEEIAAAAKTLANLNLMVVDQKVFKLPFDSGERTVIILKDAG